MKRHLTPFRVASYLLGFICLGHTGGAMIAQKSMGLASDAVFASMKAVHFSFNGSDATWYGFWMGFGLIVTLDLLLSALIAWQLDKASAASWPVLQPLGWALLASHCVQAFLGYKYFFIAPAVLETLIALLLAVGMSRARARYA